MFNFKWEKADPAASISFAVKRFTSSSYNNTNDIIINNNKNLFINFITTTIIINNLIIIINLIMIIIIVVTIIITTTIIIIKTRTTTTTTTALHTYSIYYSFSVKLQYSGKYLISREELHFGLVGQKLPPVDLSIGVCVDQSELQTQPLHVFLCCVAVDTFKSQKLFKGNLVTLQRQIKILIEAKRQSPPSLSLSPNTFRVNFFIKSLYNLIQLVFRKQKA